MDTEQLTRRARVMTIFWIIVVLVAVAVIIWLVSRRRRA
jgi:hypothetical protein